MKALRNYVLENLTHIVWPLSYALLGNGGNSLLSMDLKPPIPTKNGVISQFLKILPKMVILGRFWPGQVKIQGEIRNSIMGRG